MTRKANYLKRIKIFARELTHGISKNPLDGDRTELLSKMLNIELDFQNGNLKYNEEYDRRYAELNMEIL